MAVYTTIDDPSAYFKVQLYTGDGSVQAIAFDDTDTDMQPNLVWIKNRDQTDTHLIFDSVRGAGEKIHVSEHPEPNESTDDDTLTAFGSDGFTVGDDVKVNTNTEKYVSWNWKESATAGFDIVSYSGNSTNRTVSHSLSAIPHFYFVLARGSDSRSNAYHHKNTDAPETDTLKLTYDTATGDDATIWNDTAPTSSVFSLGTENSINDTGNTYMAYLWTSIQGFSKFGQYEGNGNANGAFVYTGFRPAFIMTKSIDSTSSWHMFDDQREGYNVDNDPLAAEVETAEATTDMIDILSNGFKFRIATDPNVAETYVYMAFAKAPLVNSNGVPCNAR